MVDNQVVIVSNCMTHALQDTLESYAEAGYRLVSAILAKNTHNIDVMYLFFTKAGEQMNDGFSNFIELMTETVGASGKREYRPVMVNIAHIIDVVGHSVHLFNGQEYIIDEESYNRLKKHLELTQEESGAANDRSELLDKILSDIRKMGYHMVDCDAMVSQDEVLEIIQQYKEGSK